MTRPASGTRERIQDVARNLFVQKGVQRTSLQDIAAQLGITKPALYYHFSSREELVRSILAPVIEEGEKFIVDQETRASTDPASPRELLEGYFDFIFRHRTDLILAVSEMTTLADLGLVDKVLGWQKRLCTLVFGPRPTLEQATRGVIAFGGMQDCCLQFPDTAPKRLRQVTVAGALAALGVPDA